MGMHAGIGAAGAGASAAGGAADEAVTRAWVGGLRVLVVDDTPVNLLVGPPLPSPAGAPESPLPPTGEEAIELITADLVSTAFHEEEERGEETLGEEGKGLQEARGQQEARRQEEARGEEEAKGQEETASQQQQPYDPLKGGSILKPFHGHSDCAADASSSPFCSACPSPRSFNPAAATVGCPYLCGFP
ncbi:unnamed protein product [Closterium sp. NIES-64]|nr:unnamed protein product [Closterium sp. NIES-64]